MGGLPLSSVVLEDPAHAVTELRRLGIEQLGRAFETNDGLRHSGFEQALWGDQTFAPDNALSKLKLHPLGKIADAGVKRSGGVGDVHAVPGNDFNSAVVVFSVRRGVVRGGLVKERR